MGFHYHLDSPFDALGVNAAPIPKDALSAVWDKGILQPQANERPGLEEIGRAHV